VVHLDVSNQKGCRFVAKLWIICSLFGATLNVSNFKDYQYYESDDEDLYDDDQCPTKMKLLDKRMYVQGYHPSV